MERSSTALRIVSYLIFAAAATAVVPAQQITGNIRGTIVDPSGAIVTNASVTATQTET